MSQPLTITSRDNVQFKELVKLINLARARRERGLSVIEGEHLLEAYRQHGGTPERIFVPEGSSRAGEAGALVLAASLFKAVSQVEHGIGPIALIATPRVALPDAITTDCVILEDLQDPGNLGAILRTCAAAGVRQIFLSPNSVYAWSPKVLRAGMGAHFALSIVEGVPCTDVLARLVGVNPRATVLSAQAESLYNARLAAPSAWVFGNEGAGVSAALQAAIANHIKIPQENSVESMNVAAAVAVCLFEQRRQRLASDS